MHPSHPLPARVRARCALDRTRRRGGSWLIGAAAFLLPVGSLTLVPVTAHAQVFELQGGGSSLSSGYGGMLNIWGGGYEGNVGLGYLDGLRFSVFLKQLLGRDTLRIGNDAIPVRFASDVFGSSNVVLAQGIGLRRATRRSSFFGFVGTSATAVPAPFVNSLRNDKPIGIVQGERILSPTLRLVTHALFSERQTLLQGVRWESPSGLQGGVTAGVGGSEPYGAASFALAREHLDVRAAYVGMRRDFRRTGVPTPAQSEVDRDNLLITVRPRPGFSIGAGRQHFRQDSTLPGVPDRATLHQVYGTARVAGADLAGGIFDSRTPGGRNVSSYLTASREITRWLQSDLYLLRVWSPEPARSTTPVLYLREFVSPRVTLVQVLTRASGRTSVSFGGAFMSGLTSVGVDYQIVHTPYRTVNPFVQTLALNVRLPLGDYRLNAASFVTPDGRVNYSGSASTFFYAGDAIPRAARPVEIRFERYLVEGRVVDDAGRPLDGAAVEIGTDLVFTDSQGRFFVRLSSPRPVPVRIVLDEFLAPGRYEVVSSPSTATPRPERESTPLRIVLRHVTLPRPDAGASLGPTASAPDAAAVP